MIEFPKNKWRPSLGMIISAVLISVMVLPLAGLIFFRFFENQLIQQTEGELIAQSAVLAAVMAKKIEQHPTNMPMGMKAIGKPKIGLLRLYHPIVPRLDLAQENILAPRPAPKPSAKSVHRAFIAIGQDLQQVVRETQKITLAGFRILDPFGSVIAGRDDIGRSFSHVREIKSALAGNYASVLRQRIPHQPIPLQSISRGTSIRIFIAMPVIVKNHVMGVIYASRTPSNVLKELSQQWSRVALAAVFIIAITLMIAFVFARTIVGPIRELSRRTMLIGAGDRTKIQPLKYHGAREILDLSQGLLEMADKLSERSDYISGFAAHVSHELKTPLSAIRGAVELMLDDSAKMNKTARQKFLGNVLDDTERLIALLERLQVLARAENAAPQGSTSLGAIVAKMRDIYRDIKIGLQGDVNAVIAMSQENAMIVFANLVDNAGNHGADAVSFEFEKNADKIIIKVKDNGSGISQGNAKKIFELFFTTRRDYGGTGMGLGIVQSLLKAHRGSIELIQSKYGATFEVIIPAA